MSYVIGISMHIFLWGDIYSVVVTVGVYYDFIWNRNIWGI